MSGPIRASDAASEDVCAIPEAMRRLLIPRRGRVTSGPLAADPHAATYLANWLDEHSAVVDEILDNGLSAVEIAKNFRASQGDLATATPLAAAVGAALAISPDTPVFDNPASVIDAWIGARGHAFAAAAAVELFGVNASGRQHDGVRTLAFLSRKTEHYEDMGEAAKYLYLAVRLREHLASAADEDHEQVSETLAGYRKTLANPATPGQVWARLLTSFLIPEHADWVEEDFALLSRSHLSAWLTVGSLTTAQQAKAFPATSISAWTFNQEPHILWTALDNLGADLLPILIRWRITISDSNSIQLLFSAVSATPSIESLQYLLDNIDKKYVTAALQAAAENFPRRTLRVLADAAPHNSPRGLAAANVLRQHIVAHDELVQDELPNLAPAARGYVEKVRAANVRVPDAKADALPPLFVDPPWLTKNGDPLTLPKVMPKIPAWADPRSLPQVLLQGRQAALPEESAGHLLLMLAVSKPGEPYPGIRMAKDICDPASLSAFAWALFENWRGAEYSAKAAWAFNTLRWFGDDETVRHLSPMIRLWPGENGHQRAVTGLDVLADIGGGTALMHLYDISQRVKFKALRERAARRVTDIAEDLGLTPEQLGDRLVPDLGLASSGTLVLDYGPRRFTVGFDEQLKPFVRDQAGKRLKALPKPGAKDDSELAPAAYQRFATLKKDVRTLAASQIARFELAMVTQRRWTSQEFSEFFVRHPLLRHIVRRLVWATFTDDKVGTAFRVAEDQTFADVADDEYTLADDASIGIAHPLHLGEDVNAWSDVFADYEILQPFEQLGRIVCTLTDEEAAAGKLTRFDGMETPVGKVLNLERRGWHRGAPQDAGIQRWISRPLPGGGSVTVDLDPGISVGYVNEFGVIQRFRAVFLSSHRNGEDYLSSREYPPFGRLDALTASEVLRDLSEVMAS